MHVGKSTVRPMGIRHGNGWLTRDFVTTTSHDTCEVDRAKVAEGDLSGFDTKFVGVNFWNPKFSQIEVLGGSSQLASG